MSYSNIGKPAWITLYSQTGMVLGTMEGIVSDFAPNTVVNGGRRIDLYLLNNMTRVDGGVFVSQHLKDEHEIFCEGEGWFNVADVRFTKTPTSN